MYLCGLAGKIGVEGHFYCNELDHLAVLAAGRDVLEVGSFKGLSAWAMAITAKSLLCVDTFKADGGGQTQMTEHTTLESFLRATERYSNVKHLAMTSAQASQIVKKKFDMVFIDAMHGYEDVRADIEAWEPKIRDQGIMVFHDYKHPDFPGVQRAVEEKFGPLPNLITTLGWLTLDRRREVALL